MSLIVIMMSMMMMTSKTMMISRPFLNSIYEGSISLIVIVIMMSMMMITSKNHDDFQAVSKFNI